MSGVFAIARAIWDDPDFSDDPFSEREALIWLIGAAAWRDSRTRTPHGSVDLKRGEFCFSVRFLADKWHWSKSRVARYLDRLQEREIIDTRPIGRARKCGTGGDQKAGQQRDSSEPSKRDSAKVYFFRNYNKFQVVGLPKRDSERDTSRDASGTAAGQQRDKEETGKQLNINIPPTPQRGRGSVLPEGWKPDEELRRYARDKGCTEAEIDRLAEEMRDWALANRNRSIARKSDWSATFRGFVRRHLDRRPKASTGGARQNGSGWYVRHGSPEFEAWKRHASLNNDGDLIYALRIGPGQEAKVPDRWPPRRTA